MKAGKWIVAVNILLAASAYAGTKDELWLGGGGFAPSGDFWEASRGASIGWRRTVDKFSLGLSIGAQTADVNDERLSGKDGFVTSSYLGALQYAGFVHHYEGDATMFPISGLVSWNIPFDKLTLSVETGIRYVFVNADVKAHMLDGITYGGYVLDAERWISDTEIGNNLLGLVGANLQFALGDNWSIFLNGGYQFDLLSSDVEFKTHWTDYNGKSITESELGGFYALAGLTYKWSSAPAGKKSLSSSPFPTTSGRPVDIGQNQKEKDAALENQLAEEKRQAEIARRAEELKHAEKIRKAEELRKAEALIKAEEQRKAEEQTLAEEALKKQEQDKAEINIPPTAKPSTNHDNPIDSVSAADMTPAKLMESLNKLDALRKQGVLSAEEYEAQRNELLKFYLGINH